MVYAGLCRAERADARIDRGGEGLAIEFRPPSLLGAAIGAALAGLAVVLAALLARPFLAGTFSLGAIGLWLGAVVLLAAASVLGYWIYALLTLRYVLSGTHLTIEWGAVREAIPLDDVERVVPAGDLGPLPRLAGVRWPGYHVGYAEAAGLGGIFAYCAGRSAADLVGVVTPGRTYLLSVREPERFRRGLEEMRRLAGPPADERAVYTTSVWRLIDLPLFQDRDAFGLVIASLVGNLGLLVFVALVFPMLPELLPLHLSATGEVDIIGLRSDLLRLPAMAFMVLASNLGLALALHARERVAALLCLAAGVFVQVLFWVAVLKIVYP